jgi:hypothetical protein
MALRASDAAFIADSGLASTWVARAIVMRQVTPSSRVEVFRAVHRALAIDSLNADAWHAYAGLLSTGQHRTGTRGVAPRGASATLVRGSGRFPVARSSVGRSVRQRGRMGDSAIALGPTMIRAIIRPDLPRLPGGSRAPNGSSPPQAPGGWPGARQFLAGLAMARAAEGDRRGARRLLLTAEAPAATTGITPCIPSSGWRKHGLPSVSATVPLPCSAASSIRVTSTSSCTCGATRACSRCAPIPLHGAAADRAMIIGTLSA